AADEDIVLDHRVMLVGTVVVADDGAGADVDAAAYGGVAEIGMVVGLGVVGDLRVLHFDEVADVHIPAQGRARTQTGIGPDQTLVADARILGQGEGVDHCIGPYPGIADHAIGGDTGAVADLDLAFENRV